MSRFGTSCVAVIVLACLHHIPAADVTLIAGKKLSGAIVSVDPQKLVIRTTDGSSANIPVRQIAVVDLGHKPLVLTPALAREQVELVDGSVLLGTMFAIKDKIVELQALSEPGQKTAPKLSVPLQTLLSVMRGAEDADRRSAWKQLVSGRGKRDLFVIKQGERLNPLPGTVIAGNAEGDRITFELESGGQRSLPLSRATGGLVFNQPPRAVIPPTICKVHDVFGNILFAQAIDLNGMSVTVTTVSGAVIRYPTLNGLAKLDFSQGNIAYLSDWEPTVTAPPPVPLEPLLTYFNDHALEGEHLILDNVTYERGVWVQPTTTLTYPLHADYREFQAILGIDDRVPVANAAIHVRIEVDGREVLSEQLIRKEKPKPITIDVKNGNELRISVSQNGLFLGSHLVLAEARLLK
ncbi:MAG: NPCBM/NEW2 domain-containing protein [Bacteroidales bacterium]|nr:NPCBM/NEW2 domain-containing protein [Bacteroidales bacterium]